MKMLWGERMKTKEWQNAVQSKEEEDEQWKKKKEQLGILFKRGGKRQYHISQVRN